MTSYYPLGRGEEMSESEYQYQYELCENAGLEDLPPLPLQLPPGEWRTRDGRELRVSAMSTEHVRNVIKLFTRGGWGEHAKILEFRLELARRGETL